jgi:hypothetical protein
LLEKGHEFSKGVKLLKSLSISLQPYPNFSS